MSVPNIATLAQIRYFASRRELQDGSVRSELQGDICLDGLLRFVLYRTVAGQVGWLAEMRIGSGSNSGLLGVGPARPRTIFPGV